MHVSFAPTITYGHRANIDGGATAARDLPSMLGELLDRGCIGGAAEVTRDADAWRARRAARRDEGEERSACQKKGHPHQGIA